MPKYKFIKYRDPENEFDHSNVEITIETERLETLLEYFEDFLKGASYHFNGHIEIVEKELPNAK